MVCSANTRMTESTHALAGKKRMQRDVNRVLRTLFTLIAACYSIIGAHGAFSAQETWRFIVPYASTGPREVHDVDRMTRSLRAIVAHAPAPISELMADLVAQALSVDSVVQVKRDRRFRGGVAGLTRILDNRGNASNTMILAGSDLLLAHTGDAERRGKFVLDHVTVVEPIAVMPFVLMCARDRCQPGESDIAKAITNKPWAFASAGTHTKSYLAAVALLKAVGRSAMHLAYGGGTSVLNALHTAQVDFAFVPLPASIPHLASGKLSAAGIASGERFPALLEMPTLDELGLTGFRAEAWFVLAVPTAVPDPLIGALRSAVTTYRLEPSSRDILLQRGLLTAEPLTRFAERMTTDRARALAGPDDDRSPGVAVKVR